MRMAARTETLQVPATRIPSLRKLHVAAAFKEWARRGSLGNDGSRELSRYTGGRC
jgi:hypothetical protein